MEKRNWFHGVAWFGILTLSSGVAFAQIESALPTEAPPAGEKMEMKSPEGKKKIGTVTLKENKQKTKVEFEGTGLRRGIYYLYTANVCPRIPKHAVTYKSAPTSIGQQVLDFTTDSGEIWIEKSLQAARPDGLTEQSERASFVLVKKVKDGLEVIGRTLCEDALPRQSASVPGSADGN